MSLSIPVINWGADRGELILVKKNKEMAELRIESEIADFEQNIVKISMENELNRETLIQTSRAIRLAQQSHQIKFEQFKLGTVTLQELNQSLLSLLRAKEAHIDSLEAFWDVFFELQKLTLFDLVNKVPLELNFENITKILN